MYVGLLFRFYVGCKCFIIGVDVFVCVCVCLCGGSGGNLSKSFHLNLVDFFCLSSGLLISS